MDLANMEPNFMPAFERHLATSSSDVFQTLWPHAENVALTAETRIAWGVVGLVAELAMVSPRVMSLLRAAPDRPNYEFHIVNALLGTIRYAFFIEC